MEFLSRLPDQLAENLRLLSRNARFASILFVFLVVAGALMILARRSDVTYEPLAEDQTFSLREIAKMKRAFSDAGLTDSRVIDHQILVPRSEKDAYLIAADEADAFPADFDDEQAKAVANHSLLATREQNRMMYKHADQQKLARMVSGFSGIDTATVQYSEEKKRTFPPVTEKRAVVAVRGVGRRALEYNEIESIRDTVVGYFVGLDRKDVTVVDMNAPRPYPGAIDSDDTNSAGHAYATKRMLESEFKSKIEERLSMYPGAVVGVNVHLETPVSTSSASELGEREPRRSLAPTLVTASIGLPNSYFRSVWRERRSDADVSLPNSADIERIEMKIKREVELAVLALLPPPAPQWSTGAQVVVTSYDDAPTTATPAVSWWKESSEWIAEHWQVVGLGLVSVLGVLFLGGRKIRSQRKQPAVAEDLPRLAPETVEQASGPQASEAGEPSAKPDPRGELSKRVREDPDAAAEVLKQWLNKAA